MKIWLLTNVPSPYQLELFQAVHARGEIELHVRFMRDSGELRAAAGDQGHFAFRVLMGLAPRWWRDEFRLHPRALGEALWGRYDGYVLSGLYTSITFVLCALILSARRKPWATWLERPRPAGLQRAWAPPLARNGIVARARTGLLRLLFALAHRGICMGTTAVEEYAALGIDRRKLLMLPYCCDVTRFRDADPRAIQSVRDRFALAGKTVYLYSGQMIARKGVDVLLEAFGRLTREYDDAVLLLLGDGALRDSWEAGLPAGLRPRVHFAGFVPQLDLPAHFAAAHVFVFPSRHDGWAVVVNEACGAGLPVIATAAVGAAADLVRDGESGFVVPRDDAPALYRAMKHFLDHPEDLGRFGQRSLELVAPFSVERGAGRFFEHVQATLGVAAGQGPVPAQGRGQA